jgi:hypothetical protein
MTKGSVDSQFSALRAAAISSAPSGEPWTLWVPCLFGAPKPMIVLQAIKVGLVGLVGGFDRGGDRFGIVAVDFDRVPVHGLEAGDLVGRVGQRHGPSMVIELLSQNTISLFSFRWPASAMASWLMPSIRQPSPPDHIGVVILTRSCRTRLAQLALGDRHADGIGNALAERAGGGLDAGGMTVFRMAGGLRAELAELLQVVDGHVRVAGQIQQRIEQHRAMAGRQHEAVAVRPVRLLRRRTSDTW